MHARKCHNVFSKFFIDETVFNTAESVSPRQYVEYVNDTY